MKKLIFIMLLLLFFSKTSASIKNEIIQNFSGVDNLKFKFTQTVNGKDETGNCIILFPKKIYCKYNFRNNKVLVSNGNSIVIKSDNNNQYYRYPLEDTALNLLLDREFILEQISNLDGRLIDDKFFLFSIEEKNQILNIFFDKNNYNLIGWQTEDIYQNLTVTYIYELKTNLKVDEKVFKLPRQN